MKISSVIKAKFIRLNLKADFTKLFIEFDEIEKEIINENIDYENSEESIFSFYSGTDYWWDVTNFRLVICENSVITHIFFEKLISIQLKEIFENDVEKTECKNIWLKLENEDEIRLRVEENTWYAVYNMLKFLILSDTPTRTNLQFEAN